MRCACSLGWIYARNEPGVPGTPPPVTIGFVPDDYAVLSTDGKPTTVVVMSDVIVNHSVGRPYFKTIDRPPSSSLRSIVTGTAATTDIARDGRSVRAAGALHKDAAARSRPVYSVAGDDAVASRKRNPKPLAHVVDDASVAGPDAGARTNKDRRSWWGRSGHRPANVVPFDRPVVTAGRGDSPPSAFDDRAVCHSLVVTLAGDSRQADRWGIVPHVKGQIFHAPIISITLQQMVRRHPVNLQHGHPTPFAHEMHVR